MRLLVCGGRDFDNADFVWAMLRKAHAKRAITLLIAGGASGADALAEQWAGATGIHCAQVSALWGIYGKAAGPLRNEAMLQLKPEGLIAFPGGNGTAHMTRLARDVNIPVWEPKP